jgi:2-keto-4-pentenoate hydratase/2-oxohepta-3-ene-1,7-dioic acid hydratase in catechol pathway
MRLATYLTATPTRPHCGVILGDALLPMSSKLAKIAGLDPHRSWHSARSVLEAGPGAWQAIAEAARTNFAQEDAVPLAGVELMAPVVDPDKIICLGLNYREHAAESNMPTPDAPMLFAKFRNSLTGPTTPIQLPRVSNAVDYEAELAVVIGRNCKDVPTEDALSYVAGAMVFNDVSARDLQHQTSQWLAGKALDGFAPCGPSLVFLDEIPDIQALAITTRVNGEILQDGNTADMLFTVAETVAFISKVMTLVPGDIIATGTPPGVGYGRDPQVYLHAGDLLDTEISGIGALSNPVVAAEQAASEPVGTRQA